MGFEHRDAALKGLNLPRLRKVLTPNDFPCVDAIAERLSGFERYYERIAQPFEWKLTRAFELRFYDLTGERKDQTPVFLRG
ncbi:MAG: hypothetical protein ACREWG_14610 [Gammaproteobacteria bacterium]